MPVPRKAQEDRCRLRLAEPSMELEQAFHKMTADYLAAGESRYTELSQTMGLAFDRYIKDL